MNLKELCNLKRNIEDMEEIVYQLEPLPNNWQLEEQKMIRDYCKLLYSEKTGRPYKNIEELRDSIDLGWRR